MKNKKGIEFSVGMIVMIIIAIVIFIISISFLFKWFGEAEVLKAEIDRQTEEQIKTALRQGTSLVAIPINIQSAGLRDKVSFGVGVRNIVDEQIFSGRIAFSGAYTPDGRDITVDRAVVEEDWLGAFAEMPSFTLKKNEMQIIPVLIIPGKIEETKLATKGDYVFNVCIYKKETPGSCTVSEIAQDPDLYTGKIYQVTVRIE